LCQVIKAINVPEVNCFELNLAARVNAISQAALILECIDKKWPEK